MCGLLCGLNCFEIDKHHAQTVNVVRADLEPSSFVSVAKYSKILSGPLRSRMRFSYLKNVLCLEESGKSCQDCSRHTMACCQSSIAAVFFDTVWDQQHTFSSGCMVATSSAFAVSMHPTATANAAGNSQSLEDCLIRTWLHIVRNSENRQQQREHFCDAFRCTCDHTAELFVS